MVPNPLIRHHLYGPRILSQVQLASASPNTGAAIDASGQIRFKPGLFIPYLPSYISVDLGTPWGTSLGT